MSIPTGSHDVERLNIDRDTRDLFLVFAFILTMPGIPLIYYGDEIGMRHRILPSKEGGFERTGARTPMQWERTVNAGFSAAPPSALYLPVDPDAHYPTVADQKGKEGSLLEEVRALIAMRKQTPALSNDAEVTFLYAESFAYPFVFLRKKGDDACVVVLNPKDAEASARVPFTSSVANAPLAMKGDVAVSVDDGTMTVVAGARSFAVFPLA